MTKQQHEQQEEIRESFKKFSDLYRSKVEFTGETLRKVDTTRLPLDPSKPLTYTEAKEISIKMPLDEFERFLQNWNGYLDLMYSAKNNQMIYEQYHQLRLLVEIYK